MGGSITTVLKFWYYNTVPLMLVSLCDLSGCTEAKCFYLGSSYPHNSYTIIQVRRGAAP